MALGIIRNGRGQLGHKVRTFRTRPDKAHIAAQYIQDLREFIDAEFPNDRADPGDPRITLCGPAGAAIRLGIGACLSRIEKSQFLTDRNVTMGAGGSRSTTIIHWSDGGTSYDGRGAVKPAAAGGGGPQGQALRRLVRRRESEPTDDVVQPVW